MNTSTKVEQSNLDEYFIKQMTKMQEQPLDSISPQLNQKIDDLKGELGEAMRMIMAIENKSVMASRSVSPIATPTRTRSNTPTPRKNSHMTQSTFGTSVSKSGISGAGAGLRSRTLTSTIVSNREFRGPVINEIATADFPMGDTLPNDPMADSDVLFCNQDEDDLDDMEIDIPEQEEEIDAANVIEESTIVKQRMTRIGNIINNIEKLDFSKPDNPENLSQQASPTAPKIDPNRRVTTRKNLGLFFGHENWNLIMHMMIAFRAGLKL